MSEYQYHEWQTVDRVLTPQEQREVNRLSSHIEVSPGKAVVTYNWGDFKHDPKQVLLDYFDAYFYQANWGSVRLMFRFPKGLLNLEEIQSYLDDEVVSFETVGAYQVLDIDFNSEDGGWGEEGNVDLSDFISLRADLLQGDYRLLYLIWLMKAEYDSEPEDESDDAIDDDEEYDDGENDENEGDNAPGLEPPVPPGLKKLSPALDNIIKAFGIDPMLVRAAAEASPDMRQPAGVDYRELIGRLTREECDDFLRRLAEGDAAVGMALRKRLGAFLPQDKPVRPDGKRTPEELLGRASQLDAAEKKRQEEEARRKHIADMKALAAREPQAWQEVVRLLESGPKSASVYDEVTAKLESLQQLSEFQDTRDIFTDRVRDLAEKYSRRPSLIERWRNRGWFQR